MRHFRFDEGRFILSLPTGDGTAPASLARMEGARYDRRRQVWTLPASLRILHGLERLGCVPHPAFAAKTQAYIATIQRPVPAGPPLVFGERTLLPHQNDGVAWLNTRTHAMLHDEQGTGKTLHALAWTYNDPLVIVCAAPVLLPQWEAEARLMGVRCEPSYVPLLKGKSAKWKTPKTGLVLVNAERLHTIEVTAKDYTVVYDESSMFKNAKTRRTQAAMGLADHASKVLCLDGNIITNRPIEAWTTYLMLKQRTRSEFWKWAERYTGSYRTPYGWDFSGATFVDELAEDITAFALRREVKDIFDLPEMFELSVNVPTDDLAKAELSVYGRVLMDDIKAGTSLKYGDGYLHLQNYRVESALLKTPFAVDWLIERTGHGSKVVVFSEFKAPLRIAQKEYNERTEFHAAKLTGDESGDERIEALRRFNEDPQCMVLFTTYSVGERGLNLQVADTALILDLPLTPARLEQAKKRVRRYGQLKPTEAVTLMSGHFIESWMQGILNTKEDIIDGLHTLGQRKEFTL